MKENELSGLVIGCAMRVHSDLGPGLLERAYEESLFYELIEKGWAKEAASKQAYNIIKKESINSLKIYLNNDAD